MDTQRNIKKDTEDFIKKLVSEVKNSFICAYWEMIRPKGSQLTEYWQYIVYLNEWSEIYFQCIYIVYVLTCATFLAHLNWKLYLAFLITCHLSSPEPLIQPNLAQTINGWRARDSIFFPQMKDHCFFKGR